MVVGTYSCDNVLIFQILPTLKNKPSTRTIPLATIIPSLLTPSPTTPDPISHTRIPLSASATPPLQQRTLAHELPISPPDTPETHRAQRVETTATNTPTQVGKFFATQIASPPSETLDSTWNAEKHTQIQQMYHAYLASKGINVGEDGLTDYMSRCAMVARMIVVSPPSDFKYSQHHKLVLAMMFHSPVRDPFFASCLIVEIFLS